MKHINQILKVMLLVQILCGEFDLLFNNLISTKEKENLVIK